MSNIVSARLSIVKPSPRERCTVLLKNVSFRLWTLKLGGVGGSDKLSVCSFKDCTMTEVPPEAYRSQPSMTTVLHFSVLDECCSHSIEQHYF